MRQGKGRRSSASIRQSKRAKKTAKIFFRGGYVV